MIVPDDGPGVHTRAPTNGLTPTWLTVDPASIPRDLTDTPAWVVWRGEPAPNRPGKWAKVPYRATDPSLKASTTDPETWSTFSDAFMAYSSDPSIHGVGYVLHDEGITGVDLDDCFAEDGSLKRWAQEIVSALPGYWERSPSGRGVRGLCRAHLPPGRRKGRVDGSSIEIYDDVRFLTITGVAL
jgi:primase-polymerase (primpol)-like protein